MLILIPVFALLINRKNHCIHDECFGFDSNGGKKNEQLRKKQWADVMKKRKRFAFQLCFCLEVAVFIKIVLHSGQNEQSRIKYQQQ